MPRLRLGCPDCRYGGGGGGGEQRQTTTTNDKRQQKIGGVGVGVGAGCLDMQNLKTRPPWVSCILSSTCQARLLTPMLPEPCQDEGNAIDPLPPGADLILLVTKRGKVIENHIRRAPYIVRSDGISGAGKQASQLPSKSAGPRKPRERVYNSRTRHCRLALTQRHSLPSGAG